MKKYLILLLITSAFTSSGQSVDTLSLLKSRVAEMEQRIQTMRSTELVQSMSQRSMLTPSYFYELKALVARQAYNFWKERSNETYVSHLNVYSALYYANKYLGYDSLMQRSYNQGLGHNASVISIRFGKKPNEFYSAGSDGKVLRWDLTNLRKVPEVIYQGDHLIKSIELSYNDEWIMIVTKDRGLIMVRNVSSLSETGPEVFTDPEPVQTAIFLPGQLKYLTVNRSGKVQIKGSRSDLAVGTSDKKVLSLAVNPADASIYAGTEQGAVEIWSDSLEANLHFKEAFAINSIAISADYKMMALGREKGDAILWDLEKKELVRIISGHQSAITDVDFSPDNRLLLTASRDATVRLWDLDDSKKLPIVLDDHNDWVMSAAFDPTGERLISGSKDNYIRVWPVDHKVLADRICTLVSRNLDQNEWREFVGRDIPYQDTCPIKN